MKGTFFLIMLSALFLSSCTQSEEVFYSCDESIDFWIKENLKDIHGMTRSEWNDLPADVAIAVYRAFTPKQKIVFWQGKFDELKQLPWKKEELIHIQIAEDFFHSHEYIFWKAKLSEEDADELDMFYYTWSKKGMKSLHWSEQKSAAIIASGYSLKDTTGIIRLAPSDNEIIKPDCTCRYDAYCFPHYCETNTCTITDGGCGVLLELDCKGICSGI